MLSCELTESSVSYKAITEFLHRIKTFYYSPQDLGQSAKLLAPCNIDHSKLLEYVTDVVKYATKGTLKNLELKIVGNNQPDIAAFDFTSIKKAEHAARIIERKGSKLLVGLVGDSLLEASSRQKRNKGERCREVKPNLVKICGFIFFFSSINSILADFRRSFISLKKLRPTYFSIQNKLY